MPKNILLVPVNHDSGMTAVFLGLIRTLQRKGIKTAYYKPIAQPKKRHSFGDQSNELVEVAANFKAPKSLSRREAQALLQNGQDGRLMELVVAGYQEILEQDYEVTVIPGIALADDVSYANRLNSAIAKALDASIIFVANCSQEVKENIEIMSANFSQDRLIGTILNKVPVNEKRIPYLHQSLLSQLSDDTDKDTLEQHPQVIEYRKTKLPQLGIIPYSRAISAPRIYDLFKELSLDIVNEGEWKKRRVLDIALCARNIPEVLDAFQEGNLLIIPQKRYDVLLAACTAFLNGVQIAGIVLSGEDAHSIDKKVLSLCAQAMRKGLPILSHDGTSIETTLLIDHRVPSLPLDDLEKIEELMNTSANYIETSWLNEFASTSKTERCSPPAFRHQLIKKARQANKRIVLPEGEEIRTIEAAAICSERGIARCVLLGDEQKIKALAESKGIQLPDNLEILAPGLIAEDYVESMTEIRKHKGLTPDKARQQLKDNITLGTMMLKMDHVDGLVAGAVNTTAATIRPALKLIKTAPESEIVSSIFFMCLPDQVMVYGDCAVNPDPTADQLASIAIDSTESAKAFGLNAKTAMISYSTGGSGSGADVEKVREATEIIRQKRPDMLLDGPLQYDAATEMSVAKSKAPDSPVAGQATVIIFPDLNTGNTTYKAVQRSANVVSIGPMLQGMAKPINDLSRGALVEDIVYTIALTAIQAEQGNN